MSFTSWLRALRALCRPGPSSRTRRRRPAPRRVVKARPAVEQLEDRTVPALYGVTQAGSLIRIDPATGAGTLVGQTGFSGLEALELGPDGSLMATANSGTLI